MSGLDRRGAENSIRYYRAATVKLSPFGLRRNIRVKSWLGVMPSRRATSSRAIRVSRLSRMMLRRPSI
jgi:hypothetical protein